MLACTLASLCRVQEITSTHLQMKRRPLELQLQLPENAMDRAAAIFEQMRTQEEFAEFLTLARCMMRFDATHIPPTN